MCGKSLRESKMTNTKKQRRYRLRKEQGLGKEKISKNEENKGTKANGNKDGSSKI